MSASIISFDLIISNIENAAADYFALGQGQISAFLQNDSACKNEQMVGRNNNLPVK